MEYSCLWLVLLAAVSCRASNTTVSEEPVPSSEVADTSRYKEQVAFINDFLRSAKTPPVEDKSLFSHSKDNKTTNEVQLPSVASSVLDTLPVYPRIPRRAAQGRKGRQHRHSTRVNVIQPVRYLLPPFRNEVYKQSPRRTTTPSYSEDPIEVEVSAPSMSSSTTERVSEVQQEEKTESSRNTLSPQHRRIFIPPPLRYLLPPFFYENYLNAQQSTTGTPSTSGNSFESSSTESIQQKSTVETTSLRPIIVIETASESYDESNSWQNEYIEGSQQSISSSNNDPTNSLGNRELYNIENPSTPRLQSQSTTSTPLTPTNDSSPVKFENKEVRHNPKNLPSQKEKYDTQDSGKQIEFGTLLRKPSTNIPLSSTARSIFPIPRSLSSTSFPVLRGPNIEQTLFETGDFQTFDTPSNDTKEVTVSLMDKPLLAKEVADAGMKIMVNMKEVEITRKKFNRGKYKYNNLNQFNFQNEGSYRKTSTSKLSVAESSYYNDKRGVKDFPQEADIHVIPGEPGRDYPTLTQPPTNTNFCRSVDYHRGYVADVSTGCQVFYICAGNGPGEAMLCPNGTLFSQDFLVCDWWYNVDCQPPT